MLADEVKDVQIHFIDERFYALANEETGEMEYYPNVTTVLSKGAPTSKHLFDWWLDLGRDEAKAKLDAAANRGSFVHECIERLLWGEEVKYEEKWHGHTVTREWWGMVCKAAEFLTANKHLIKTIGIEKSVVSPTRGTGGTLDWVLELAGITTYIDHKTSKSIHQSHHLQGHIYSRMWNDEAQMGTKIDGEYMPEIEQGFILWLNSSHRTQKTTKIGGVDVVTQGKGWQLVPYKKFLTAENDQAWAAHKWMFDYYNPDFKPANVAMPSRLSF